MHDSFFQQPPGGPEAGSGTLIPWTGQELTLGGLHQEHVILTHDSFIQLHVIQTHDSFISKSYSYTWVINLDM